MPPAIPTRVPDKINAGDTVKFTISNSDYPATTGSWVLTFIFINGDNKITMTSSADGEDHAVAEVPADTAKYAQGLYYWKCYANDGTDRYQIAEGRTEILQNIEHTNVKSSDLRSHVKKVLDAVEAVIEDRASDSDLSMSVDGQSITNFTPEQLTDLRDKYRGLYTKELNRERTQQGRNSRRNKKIRFTDN